MLTLSLDMDAMILMVLLTRGWRRIGRCESSETIYGAAYGILLLFVYDKVMVDRRTNEVWWTCGWLGP